MNIVCLRGNLVKEVEVRFTGTGKAVSNFTIAVNRPFKNEKDQYEADFINCVVFNKSAEYMQNYTNKGDMIEVVGSLQTSSYQDKDGNTRYKTEVLVDKIERVQKKDAMPF